jgi:hypothetical protein
MMILGNIRSPADAIAQLASHMTATNNTDSPSMITIMSYCSSARVRRRRLSFAGFISGL